MINKPILNVLSAIVLLCPVVGSATCLGSNDSANNQLFSDCHSKAEYHLAGLSQVAGNPSTNSQAIADQPGLLVVDVTEASKVGSKVRVEKSPKNNEQPFDNHEWMPADWYEAY